MRGPRVSLWLACFAVECVASMCMHGHESVFSSCPLSACAAARGARANRCGRYDHAQLPTLPLLNKGGQDTTHRFTQVTKYRSCFGVRRCGVEAAREPRSPHRRATRLSPPQRCADMQGTPLVGQQEPEGRSSMAERQRALILRSGPEAHPKAQAQAMFSCDFRGQQGDQARRGENTMA